MKKITTLFALVFIALCSCKKADSGGVGNDSYNYIINGVADITIPANSTSNLNLEVKYSSGTQETVNLSVTGLPTGVTATITPASGIPTYTSVITFAVPSGVAAGTYPIKINGTSKSGIVKEYACNLKVTAVADCAGYLAGTFTGDQQCSSSGSTYSYKITKDTGINRVLIANTNGFISSMYAIVDCSNNTLTIPSQTIHYAGIDHTISGSGTFTSNYNNIVVEFIEDGFSCTFTGTR